MLTEYFKFHIDIPRMFLIEPANIIHRFHDTKRRLNYNKVKKMLNEDLKRSPKKRKRLKRKPKEIKN